MGVVQLSGELAVSLEHRSEPRGDLSCDHGNGP